ncbi:MAG: DUF3187 family protein [Pseudomonadaceae bacterium]|nr:DUF3187 family protein [Pseudomonadaceae bacterium]
MLSSSAVTAGAVENGPLQVRNMSPTTLIYGLPRMVGTELVDEGATSAVFHAEIANNFSSDRKSDTLVFFDGETSVYSYTLKRRVGAVELGVELPWVSHSGGNLDGFIDEFHQLFGFNDGSRYVTERNQIDYFVQYDGENYVDFQDSRSDIGDVRLLGAMEVFSRPGRSLTARGQLKLPTGELESLSGSGATDVALWLEYADAQTLSDYRLSLSAGAGFGYLGKGDLAPDVQKSGVGFGHLGLAYAYSQALSLHAQLDFHTTMVDTSATQVSHGAVQGTLGGRYRVNSDFWFDVALVEDIRSQSSPDVIFQLLLGIRL